MKLFCLECEYRSRKSIEKAYPGLAVIKKVCGGWMCFEFLKDYEAWMKQK